MYTIVLRGFYRQTYLTDIRLHDGRVKHVDI
jgi:hypothetical protein